MESTLQVRTPDNGNAQIVRDGNRFCLEPYTSYREALVVRMAENKTLALYMTTLTV